MRRAGLVSYMNRVDVGPAARDLGDEFSQLSVNQIGVFELLELQR